MKFDFFTKFHWTDSFNSWSVFSWRNTSAILGLGKDLVGFQLIMIKLVKLGYDVSKFVLMFLSEYL